MCLGRLLPGMLAGDMREQPPVLPEYLFSMVRRLPPEGTPLVPGSTPVVAFGNPSRAEVATLGINPSANEFLRDRQLLDGAQRRLATLKSLRAERLDRLTDTQVATVVADCATYFDRRPYRRRFDPLDELMREAADARLRRLCLSSRSDPVGDEPVWGEIADRGIQRALLEDGGPHLEAQLAAENVDLVLLNGREVLDQVQGLRLADLEEVDRLRLGPKSCRLHRCRPRHSLDGLVGEPAEPLGGKQRIQAAAWWLACGGLCAGGEPVAPPPAPS